MMALLLRVLTLAVFFLVVSTNSFNVLAQIRINELSASNSSVLQDEDGDYSDWIELYNPTTDTLYLSNLFLSDDHQDLQKFALPPISIPPSGYQIIFASDKNRLSTFKAWDTPIRDGSNVRFIVPNALTTDRWIERDFNDANWTQGVFGIGYGDGDDATEVPTGTLSIFTRSSFTISDTSNVNDMMFHIDYDDAFVAYLNGIEIARDNITGDAPLAFNHPADNYTEPRLPYDNALWSTSIAEYISLLKPGENILAIQLHNFNSTSSDLSLRPFLSIGYAQSPEVSVEPAELVKLPKEDNGFIHTNFKLSSSGETVYLTTAEGEFVDSLAFPPLLVDESFGRSTDQSNGLIFNIPTPNYPNVTEGYTRRLSFPELSHYGGFYTETISLKALFGVNPTAVYYTLDGSTPTQSDQRLPNEGLSINETTVVRLRAIEPNALPSPVHTQTFFINEQHNLPVVSVSTDPKYLWSDTEGIYVVGTNGIGGNGHDNANWNQDWEIPIGFELYDQNKVKQIETGAGAKIMGGWSRLNPMKSLSIFFRSEYGLGEIDYKLFENKDITRFESIVLRNAGNDFTSQGNAMMRDGLMQTLVHDTEIDGLGFQPAVVYLNGEYWGIHNIREKINEHYVESNSGVDSDNIDLLYNGSGLNFFAASHGTAEQYDALIDYVRTSNLLFPSFFEKVEEMMDMDNYIDYVVAQIYYANTDWPGNNTKLWRERSQTGKWRWILYDTDFGFNLSYGGQSWHNTLDFALEPNGPGWPNPPWSTLLLRQLFDSAEFRARFVNRTADFINTSFKPDHVHGVIDSLAGLMYTEMPRHMANVTRSGAWGGSMNEWYNQLTSLKNFGTERPEYIEQFYTQARSLGGHLGVGPLTNTSVQINDPVRGQIQLNRLLIDEEEWTGRYFGGVDIPVRAIPRNGFEFSGWTGDIVSSESAITIEAGMNITAHFSPSTDTLGLVISEIMYNTNNSQDSEDWIELYNGKNSTLDLTDWVVKDDDNSHEFRFPTGTTLESNEYAILVRDSSLFNTIYTHSVRILGQLDYGLSGGGDQVRVFDAFGTLIDSVQYDDSAPWPLAADGEGYSLELLDLSSDNSLPQSWNASKNLLGSPGLANGLSTSNTSTIDYPIQYELNQNYPNPFNPSTWISFSLPQATTARIEIYSGLGQKIMTLTEGYYTAGQHHIQWNAEHYASGVYFYRLVTSEFSDTKKMLLVK